MTRKLRAKGRHVIPGNIYSPCSFPVRGKRLLETHPSSSELTTGLALQGALKFLWPQVPMRNKGCQLWNGLWTTSSELVTSTENERSAREWYLNCAVRGRNRDWAMGSTWAGLVGGRETLVKIKHVKGKAPTAPVHRSDTRVRCVGQLAWLVLCHGWTQAF